MRCQKSKRVCPGYRDAFELNLRDETKTTKKKMARMINHRSFIDGVSQFHGPLELISPSTTSSITPPMTASDFDPYNSAIPYLQNWEYLRSHAPTLSPSNLNSMYSFEAGMTQRVDSADFIAYHSGCMLDQLSVPVDQQAASFFLSNFVIVPGHGSLRGYLNFVLPYIGSQQVNSVVNSAFSAVSLAAFGSRPNAKALLPKADAAYYTALKEINATLKNPSLSTDESTLAAILMLSMFEVSFIWRPKFYKTAYTLTADNGPAKEPRGVEFSHKWSYSSSQVPRPGKLPTPRRSRSMEYC
jgi:hypothetical protein